MVNGYRWLVSRRLGVTKHEDLSHDDLGAAIALIKPATANKGHTHDDYECDALQKEKYYLRGDEVR